MKRAALAAALLAACSARPAPPLSIVAAPPVAAGARPVERIVDGSFAFQGAITQGGLAVGQAPPGVTGVTLDGKPLPLDAKGRFLIGFGRDAAGFAVVQGRLRDGTIVRENLRVAPREWKIERIPSLKQNLTPNPVYDALRGEELARIKGARSVSGDADGWAQRFVWPVHGRISGVFGSQRILGGVPMNPHGGFDIAAPAGTPLTAPADATVALAGPPKFSLEGNLLILDHGNHLFSSFLHMSRIDVKVGQKVKQGQVVGAVGMTGRATGPHLHWGLNWGEVRLDPQLLVPPGG